MKLFSLDSVIEHQHTQHVWWLKEDLGGQSICVFEKIHKSGPSSTIHNFDEKLKKIKILIICTPLVHVHVQISCKIKRHDIAEISIKLALNTNQCQIKRF